MLSLQDRVSFPQGWCRSVPVSRQGSTLRVWGPWFHTGPGAPAPPPHGGLLEGSSLACPALSSSLAPPSALRSTSDNPSRPALRSFSMPLLYEVAMAIVSLDYSFPAPMQSYGTSQIPSVLDQSLLSVCDSPKHFID